MLWSRWSDSSKERQTMSRGNVNFVLKLAPKSSWRFSRGKKFSRCIPHFFGPLFWDSSWFSRDCTVIKHHVARLSALIRVFGTKLGCYDQFRSILKALVGQLRLYLHRGLLRCDWCFTRATDEFRVAPERLSDAHSRLISAQDGSTGLNLHLHWSGRVSGPLGSTQAWNGNGFWRGRFKIRIDTATQRIFMSCHRGQTSYGLARVGWPWSWLEPHRHSYCDATDSNHRQSGIAWTFPSHAQP